MIFQIHYALWFGGLVGIMPFMVNYAETYAGATGFQCGILFSFLPFVALVAKPVIGSIADRYDAHRSFLILFVFLTAIGFGSLAVYPTSPSFVSQNQSTIWILYCMSAFVGDTSMAVVNSIGDTLAVNSSIRKNTSYGRYRMWGPIGFGLFGTLWGLTGDISIFPKFVFGLLTLIVIHAIDIVMLSLWRDSEDFKLDHGQQLELANPNSSYGTQETTTTDTTTTPQETQNPRPSGPLKASLDERFRWLWNLCCHDRSIYGYMILFAFCGLVNGIHWRFFYGYLAQIAVRNKENFSHIATLTLPVQAFCGELVFFMISGHILSKLGPLMSLTLSMACIAIRYLAYAYLISMLSSAYWILGVELLQGPAFGLMYTVLTERGHYYSRQLDEIVSLESNHHLKNSLTATIQGLLGASFEGLGVGLGSIIGGLLYDKGPEIMWKISGFGSMSVAIACLAIQWFARRHRLQ